MQPDVDALVLAARSGDKAAAETLVRDLYPAVVRYCRAHLGAARGHATADDVAQDACLAVWRALPGYRPRPVPAAAWVWAIVHHKVADAQRRAARTPTPVDGWDERRSETQDPGDVVAGRDEQQRAWALLQHLTETQRRVVVMRVAVGMSAEEVGGAVGMTASAVRVVQSRALAQLRALAGREVVAPWT